MSKLFVHTRSRQAAAERIKTRRLNPKSRQRTGSIVNTALFVAPTDKKGAKRLLAEAHKIVAGWSQDMDTIDPEQISDDEMRDDGTCRQRRPLS